MALGLPLELERHVMGVSTPAPHSHASPRDPRSSGEASSARLACVALEVLLVQLLGQAARLSSCRAEQDVRLRPGVGRAALVFAIAHPRPSSAEQLFVARVAQASSTAGVALEDDSELDVEERPLSLEA